VSDLSQKGYLDTVRGRGGGIRLRRPPRDINIGRVLRETEDKLDVIGCLGRRDYCPIERVCVLRGVLHDVSSVAQMRDLHSFRHLRYLLRPKPLISQPVEAIHQA
jgi:Rrf2 family protein